MYTVSKVCLIVSILVLNLSCIALCQPTSENIQQGTIVFLDTSASMKGYFNSTEVLTNLQKFVYTEFRNILSTHDAFVPLYLCPFGLELEAPPREVRVFNFYSDAFFQKSTDIINVLRSRMFDNYALSIIITDGIQSDPQIGFDRGEMKRAIQEKLDEGFLIYLIGIKAKFDGTVYSEIDNNIQFTYRGLRPIYMWLATHNERLGETVVSDMVQRFGSIANEGDVINMVRLHGDKFPQVDRFIPEEFAEYHLATKIENKQDWYEIELYNPGRNQRVIEIPITFVANTFGSPWKISVLMANSHDSPWAQIKSTSVENQWKLELDYSRIPRRKTSAIELDVIGSFEPQTKWWQDWSTTDDTRKENVERTLYLEDLVEEIISPIYYYVGSDQPKRYKLKSLYLGIKR